MCNVSATVLYFWLMTEIMFFYILTGFIVCYFFRRFCQDPKLAKEEEEQEALKKQSAVEMSSMVAKDTKDQDPEANFGVPVKDE